MLVGHAAWAQPAPDAPPPAGDGSGEPKPPEPAGAPPAGTPPTEAPKPEQPAAGAGGGDGKAALPRPQNPANALVLGVIDAPELDAPLAGATVSVEGGTATTTTDADGKYQLELPPGKVKLKIEFSGFKAEDKEVDLVAGQTLETNVSLGADQSGNEVIVVVGSRTPRTNVETTAPVDVVSAEEIARVGRTETSRILHTLAASYVSTPQTIADGSDHVDPASLRGLGPDQVLVLVNGKRRHKSALLHVNGTFGRGTVGTDLNAIAAESIKRIEILRDGAASQYGSDAIAGVINIETKDVTDLVEISALGGLTGSGDGGQIETSANYGFKIGDKGFLNLTGEFLKKNPTNRAGTYTGPVYSSDTAMDNAALAAAGLSRSDFKMKIGEAAATVGIGAYNLEIPFGDAGAKFYSFGDVGQRFGNAAGFYRFPFQTTQNVAQFYPNGFLPEIHTDISDVAATVGVKKKGTWDVDASLTTGRNRFKFDIENSVNASLGTDSPTTFDAGTLAAQETTANLDLLRKIKTDAVKALSFVAGSEYRIENYTITPGDPASYEFGNVTVGMPPTPAAPGAQVFPGFQPSNAVDRTRNSIGVYAGGESSITKEWQLDAGGRFEQYSDFGHSLIGKVATRVEPIHGLALRAAGSTGFRAPSLQQLWFSNVSTQFLMDPQTGTLQPFQVLTANNESPIAKAFGIPKLHEERSFNASGGLALRPVDNLSVTADGYFIRIKDRIVLTSPFNAKTNADVANLLVDFPDVSQAQFFANAVDTDTKGVDVVADYNVDLADAGSLVLTGSANFTQTKVTNVHVPDRLVGQATSDQLRTFFFGRLAQNRLEDSVPHIKATAAARYRYAGATALLRANYYGKVYYKPDDPANDETFGAKTLFDVVLGYQFTKSMMLSVGADNLLNTFPDKQTKDANISFGRFIYSRNVSQFGENGGFYYLKMELTFF